ncbi:MAG TPA: hypothetical protein PLU30_12665 [Verrucomicrobiae bacterium]|nr:hypothetical protein [Verrucomicrobiae bacterium]
MVTVISISRNALIDPPNGIRGLFEYVVRFLGYSEEGIPIMYEELYDFKRLGTSKGLEDLKERTLANLRGVLTAYHRTKILRRSAPQIMPRFYLEQKALDDIEMAAMRRETSRLGLTPF